MLLHGQMEDLDDWRALRPLEWLSPVKSVPNTDLAWLYVSEYQFGNSSGLAGGMLVQVKGYQIRRVRECHSMPQ